MSWRITVQRIWPVTALAKKHLDAHRRIYPLLRELHRDHGELCTPGVLRMDDQRRVAMLGVRDPGAILDDPWWAERRFRVRGVLHIRDIHDGAVDPVEPELFVEQIIHGSLSRALAWWLILSYAYYECDHSLVEDWVYDALCARLLKEINDPELADHQHAHLCDVDLLRAGSGYALRGKYPLIVRNCAHRLINDQGCRVC